MERVLPSQIETALLYDGFDAFEADVLVNLINEFGAGYGVQFERTKHERAPLFLHIHGAGLTIEITYSGEAIHPSVFQNALASEVTKLTFPDARQAVKSHNHYVYLRIINGEVSPPDPFRQEPEELENFSDSKFDFATALMRILLAIQITKTQPLAVYWAPCDRLLEMRQFLEVALEPKDLSLLAHPVILPGPENENGEPISSLITFGSKTIIGKEVQFEPCMMPIEEQYDLILQFLQTTKNTGLYMPEGERFGRDESEEIRVTYEASEKPDVITLVCERSETYGINNIPEVEEEDQPAFNLDDPTERAMHEKIRELKRVSETVNVGEESLDPDAETHVASAVESWTGVKKRIDVSSLRTLANTKLEPSAEESAEASEEEAEPAPSMKSKVGGLFAKRHA